MEHIIRFGTIKGGGLGWQMFKKTITTCNIEEFHSENCLAAMVPVSNYILVEKICRQMRMK